MELLYLVDAEDNTLGSVERGEAHRTLALHRSGIIFVLNNEKRVFIQHRSKTEKIFGSCYDSSSSFHVAFGETY